MQSAGPIARWTVFQEAIPLFAKRPSHPFVPLDGPKAVARRRGQGPAPDLIRGRPSAGAGALSLTAASTIAGWYRRRGRLNFRVRVRPLLAMLRVCALATALHVESAPAMAASESDPYAAPMVEATERFGIPIPWVQAIIRAESGGDRHALSPKGAMGLMQIMPKTWAELSARYGLGRDPFDPHDNILAGVAYLREMHHRYGSPGFLAAYHAGPGRYEDYRDRHRPLPPETQAYVGELLPLLSGGEERMPAQVIAFDSHAWTHAPLFTVRLASTETDTRIASGQTPNSMPAAIGARDLNVLTPRSDGLFVALSTVEHKP